MSQVIEHSPMLNDFLVFYIETKVDGTLRYETVIYFYPTLSYTIRDILGGTTSSHDFSDERTVESEIHARIEGMVQGSPDGRATDNPNKCLSREVGKDIMSKNNKGDILNRVRHGICALLRN